MCVLVSTEHIEEKYYNMGNKELFGVVVCECQILQMQQPYMYREMSSQHICVIWPMH